MGDLNVTTQAKMLGRGQVSRPKPKKKAAKQRKKSK